MVFRNGFRVYPYGSPDDDWLDLDKKALASGGYKVNRRQLVGRIVISIKDSPALLDQSNREGLRDSEEKRVLIRLLKYFLETQFRTFLNRVEQELKVNEPTTFEDLEEHIERPEEKIAAALRTLIENHAEVGEDSQVVNVLRDAVADLNRRLSDAKALAESFDTKHAQVIHMAATGMMVEMLAHELNRATANCASHALRRGADRTFAGDVRDGDDVEVGAHVSATSPKDLGSHEHDRPPEEGDVRDLGMGGEIFDCARGPAQREEIGWRVRSAPEGGTLRIKAVKGMIVQVVENLLSNSIYWLGQRRKTERSFRGLIDVVVYVKKRAICFTDNGPGIPAAAKEEIFQPFITTKPPGEGKGLGLYIARELAKYHDASLSVSDDVTTQSGYLNTVVFALGDGS